MRKLLTVLFIILASGSVFAQAPVSKGQFQLNAGVGFGWGIPIYVGFDVGVHQDITVGGQFSFASYHDNWNGDKYNHTIIGIEGHGNYHFNRILNIQDNWDLYAGLHLGYYYWNSPDLYGGADHSGIGLGIQIGGRYYFSQKFGLNLELGGGTAFSGGKFGVTIRF